MGDDSERRASVMSQIPDDKVLTAGDMRTILKDHSRFFKNGESWGEYFGKWITPQNLLLVIMFGYTVGGRVQQAQTDIAAALKSNAQLVGEVATLSKAVDTQQRAVVAQQKVIEAQREMFATKENLVALQERMRLNVTRHEFQEFQRTVLPTLRRIERSVDQR